MFSLQISIYYKPYKIPFLSGLFKENGPFVIGADRTLKSRQNSWHLRHNLLYIDNPIGTGFSFSAYEAGYSKNQVDVGNNLYNVLQQFLTLFPELRGNPFYITGLNAEFENV